LGGLPTPGPWSEECLYAEIVAMVQRHCGAGGNELDSGGIPVHAVADENS
jgi:hypothetical protein